MIKPIIHRILIKPDNIEDSDDVVRSARAAGLEVKLDKREQAAIELGTVLDIGSTCYREFGTTPEEQGIQIGTRVFFAKYAGKSVKDGENKFLIMNDEDIMGVITNE
jgi:co-chaperonin GroES (HSP10)